MTYVSLYRKYRSQTFDQVIGQEPITRTLQNAVRTGHIAHAYLFCGPRGTGKTTTARLLAKALNCEHGPTPTPCDECEACRRIRDGQAMDVVEIDAASNRGIDEIRNLRENVKFVPAEGRYKIYVIDEVHMLTTEAFNALLKTLEEPPENVVFVLATTESHKVPATVLSRCQRFDFKRGGIKEILKRLNTVAKGEGIELDPRAANLIAKNAQGSYRDSLSLLEQVIAFSGTKVTLSDTVAVLGALDSEMLCRVGRELSTGDASAAFRIADELLGTGRDLRQLLWGLTEHFRNLMIVRLSHNPSALADIPAEIWPEMDEQAQNISIEQAMSAIDILSEADKDSRWNNQHSLILEVTLLKLVQLLSGHITQPAASRQQESVRKEAPVAKPSIQKQEPTPPVSSPEIEISEDSTETNFEEMPPLPDEAPPDISDETPQDISSSGELQKIRDSWPKIADEVATKSKQGSSVTVKLLLKQSIIITDFSDHQIIFSAASGMARDRATELKSSIEKAYSDLLGTKILCRIMLGDSKNTAESKPSPNHHAEKTTARASSVVPSLEKKAEIKEEGYKAPKEMTEKRKAIRQEALSFFDGTVDGG